MRKITCLLLAYLFITNPVMANLDDSKSVNGILKSNGEAMTLEDAKAQLAEQGLTQEEQQEVSDYIDFAIANKIPSEQAGQEINAMLANVSHSGASFTSDFVLAMGALMFVILLAAAIDGDVDVHSTSSRWTCRASSPSYTAVGYGSTISIAQDNALAKCARNSYYYEDCITSASRCY